MSFVIARPAALARAAGEVSASAAAQFSARAAIHQAAGAPAMAVHEPFTAPSGAGAGSYAATEAANTNVAS